VVRNSKSDTGVQNHGRHDISNEFYQFAKFKRKFAAVRLDLCVVQSVTKVLKYESCFRVNCFVIALLYGEN
jgi:hypothetical protein